MYQRSEFELSSLVVKLLWFWYRKRFGSMWHVPSLNLLNLLCKASVSVSIVRMSLLMSLKNLDIVLVRSSMIVFSRCESRIFFAISWTFWTNVCSADSTSLVFFSFDVKSPASRACTGMVVARVILTGLEIWISSSLSLRTNMETIVTLRCVQVVKVRMRALFLTQLICYWSWSKFVCTSF